MNIFTKTTRVFIIITIAALPLYLVRFSIFKIPTNIPEVLAIISIFFFLVQQKFFAALPRILNKKISYSILLFFVGLFSSYIANGPTVAGAGILKGWFLIPVAFAFVVALMFTENVVPPLLALFYSSACVALVSIGYAFFDLYTYDGRLAAFYDSPNYLAMFLAPGIITGFTLLRFTLSARKKGHILTLLAVQLIALYYTFSYASWIALAVAFAPSLFIIKKKKNVYFSLFLTIVIASFFFSQWPSQKLYDALHVTERSSLASRIMIWRSTEKMLLDNPLFGIGPGNFQSSYLAYQQYFPPYLEWAVPHPHNIYFAVYLYAGLLGIISFMCILYFAIQALLRKRKEAPLATLLGITILLYTLALGIVDTPLFKNDLSFSFWILLFLSLGKTKD